MYAAGLARPPTARVNVISAPLKDSAAHLAYLGESACGFWYLLRPDPRRFEHFPGIKNARKRAIIKDLRLFWGGRGRGFKSRHSDQLKIECRVRSIFSLI